MVLLLTILFLLRKIPSGVPPKRGRSRETRVPGVSVIKYSHWPTVVLVSLACSHVQIGTHMRIHARSLPTWVGRARVPSLRIQIQGGQGTIETEVLKLDMYLGDLTGLGSVCPTDRAAGRANQSRGKNEDKPQQNRDQEMDKNIPWD